MGDAAGDEESSPPESTTGSVGAEDSAGTVEADGSVASESGADESAAGESNADESMSEESDLDESRSQAPAAEDPSPQEFIEAALFEAHHLANLTGLDEAKLARRRLVNAQSASRRTKTRDLLADACEYLKLAGMERHDAAAGFAKARRYARNAALELRHELPTTSEKSVAELLRTDLARERRSLGELRSEATVQSYERLRRDAAMEIAFAEIRSQASDGVIDDPHAVGDGEEILGTTNEETTTVEEALRMASLEVDIRHAVQNGLGAGADSKFQFLTQEQLVSDDGEPGD